MSASKFGIFYMTIKLNQGQDDIDTGRCTFECMCDTFEQAKEKLIALCDKYCHDTNDADDPYECHKHDVSLCKLSKSGLYYVKCICECPYYIVKM